MDLTELVGLTFLKRTVDVDASAQSAKTAGNVGVCGTEDDPFDCWVVIQWCCENF